MYNLVQTNPNRTCTIRLSKFVATVAVFVYTMIGSAEILCTEIYSKNVKYVKTPKYFGRLAKRESSPTVQVDRIITNSDNETFFLMRKKGRYWFSVYTPSPENFQGDPRWPIMVLGPRVAKLLGYKQLSSSLILVPTAETLNKRIQLLNLKLAKMNAEPISVKFHASGIEPEDGISYLRKFKENLSLPIANSGHYAVHDWSYHTLALLLPPAVLKQIGSHIEILLNFHQKIKSDMSLSEMERFVLLEYWNKTVATFVRSIDYGTGNIGFVLAMESQKQIDAFGNRYEAYHLQSSVLHHLLKMPNEAIRNMKRDIENVYANKIGLVYGTEELDIYFSKEANIRERERVVEKSKKSVSLFVDSFIQENTTQLKELDGHFQTEALVNFVRERIRNLQKIKE